MFAGAQVACVGDDQISGRDRGVLMPSARAKWVWQDEPDAEFASLHYRPALEVGVAPVRGEFAIASRRGDYTTVVLHAAYAPEFSFEQFRLSPLAGMAFGDFDANVGLGDSGSSGLGVTIGAQAEWTGLTPLVPYCRYQYSSAFDWSAGRFEAGFELRIATAGLQFAYARQLSRFEEVESRFQNESARIESDGLHFGLSLRF